ncbi:MAG: cyclic nucleotide-binding domain-containing protein, partial [Deltaproteobacteria bacterium]
MRPRRSSGWHGARGGRRLASMTEEGIIEVVEALGANPLFAALDAPARALLADHMELVTYPAGAEIIRRGDLERVLYLVVEGRARVRAGAVDLGPVERGEHFGELSLLDGQPRSATVTAETALRLARLDLARYAVLTQHDAGVGLAFVQALMGGVANRLRGT